MSGANHVGNANQAFQSLMVALQQGIELRVAGGDAEPCWRRVNEAADQLDEYVKQLSSPEMAQRASTPSQLPSDVAQLVEMRNALRKRLLVKNALVEAALDRSQAFAAELAVLLGQ